MKNYQLYRTNVLLGGQMKYDLILDSTSNKTYIKDLHISPISKVAPHNKHTEEHLLLYSNQDNIKTYYRDTANFFYKDFTNSSLKNSYALPDQYNGARYNSEFEMGCRRMSYQLYNKQFEFLCPLWIEQLDDIRKLEFEIQIRTNKSQTNPAYSRSVYFDSDKIITYFNNYLKHIRLDKGCDWVFNISKDACVLYGLNVKTGELKETSLPALYHNLVNRERPVLEINNMIINELNNNSMIALQLFNFNLCFNYEDIFNAFVYNELYDEPIYIKIVAKIDNQELGCYDIFSNHEYIEKEMNSIREFNCKFGEVSLSDNHTHLNALDYLKDYTHIDLVDKNKLLQTTCYWCYSENQSSIFNLYDGFSSVYYDSNNNTLNNQYYSGIVADIKTNKMNDSNINTTRYWCDNYKLNVTPHRLISNQISNSNFTETINIKVGTSETIYECLDNWYNVAEYESGYKYLDCGAVNGENREYFNILKGDFSEGINALYPSTYPANAILPDNLPKHRIKQFLSGIKESTMYELKFYYKLDHKHGSSYDVFIIDIANMVDKYIELKNCDKNSNNTILISKLANETDYYVECVVKFKTKSIITKPFIELKLATTQRQSYSHRFKVANISIKEISDHSIIDYFLEPIFDGDKSYDHIFSQFKPLSYVKNIKYNYLGSPLDVLIMRYNYETTENSEGKLLTEDDLLTGIRDRIKDYKNWFMLDVNINEWINNLGIGNNKAVLSRIYFIYSHELNKLIIFIPWGDNKELNFKIENFLLFKNFLKYCKESTFDQFLNKTITNVLNSASDSHFKPIVFNNGLTLKSAPGPSLSVREINYYKSKTKKVILRQMGKIKPVFIQSDDLWLNNHHYYKQKYSEVSDEYKTYMKTQYLPNYPSINYFTIQKDDRVDYQCLNNEVDKKLEYNNYTTNKIVELKPELNFEYNINDGATDSVQDLVKKYITDLYSIVVDEKYKDEQLNYIYNRYKLTHTYIDTITDNGDIKHVYKIQIKLI